MSIRTAVVSLAAVSLFAIASGCEYHDCQEGAICDEDDEHDDVRPGTIRETCTDYCVRASVCGAPQARDFDECVEACEERFDRAPDRTRELCECAEWSSCTDVVEGRCSPRPPSTGGAGGRGNAHGGTPSGGTSDRAGAPAVPSAGSGAGPATGGTPGVGGSSGASGGTPPSGGTSSDSGGTGGCTAGAGTGGTGVAGSGIAPVGGAGGSVDGEGGESSCTCG